MIARKNTLKIKVGNVFIGGDAPVSVQSMTNTDTRDADATITQIKRLQDAGCDIVRVAVPDVSAAQAIEKIKNHIDIPLVADIHFDHRLAIESMRRGADKIRINPGNIGSREKVKEVVDEAKKRNIPIRAGVNSGSLEKDILAKYGGITAEGLVESALNNVRLLEELDFRDIVISLKASSVPLTVSAYRILSEKTAYPLHLGVTEAGTIFSGTIKSCVGIGALLCEGIGDTIRVSLTGDPVEEVKVAKEILKAVGHIKEGIEIISCPTCGRCRIDLVGLTQRIESKLESLGRGLKQKHIKIAIMGCAVNGPGEARDADIGIAGGKNEALLFKKGQIIAKIPEQEIEQVLLEEIYKMQGEPHSVAADLKHKEHLNQN